jgi:hypothetical protein
LFFISDPVRPVVDAPLLRIYSPCRTHANPLFVLFLQNSKSIATVQDALAQSLFCWISSTGPASHRSGSGKWRSLVGQGKNSFWQLMRLASDATTSASAEALAASIVIVTRNGGSSAAVVLRLSVEAVLPSA